MPGLLIRTGSFFWVGVGVVPWLVIQGQILGVLQGPAAMLPTLPASNSSRTTHPTPKGGHRQNGGREGVHLQPAEV